MKPQISFVIPSHNCAHYLPHSVDSALGQKGVSVEVVIVNDASTDSTPDYLAWLEKQGKPVKIINFDKNLGRSVARNWGNNAASADVIAVLDADDLATPRRAELTLAKFKAGAEFVHGAAHRMDAVGRDLGMMPTDVFDKAKAIETLTNGIVHSTVAYSKSFAMRYPYQSGDVARLGVDDWACFLAAAMDGVKFEYVASPLCAYRDGVGISAVRDEAQVQKFKRSFMEGYALKA